MLKPFFQNLTVYSLSTVFPVAINFLTLPIFAIYLSPTDYGIYETFIITTTLIGILSRLGVPKAILRFHSSENTFKVKFLIEGIILIFLGSVIVIPLCVILFIHLDLFRWEIKETQTLFIIMSTCIFFTTLWELTKGILQAQNKALQIGLITIISFCISLAVKSFLILYMGQRLPALVYADVASNALLFIISSFLIIRRLDFSQRNYEFKEILNYGVPTSFHRLNTWAASYAHTVTVPLYLSVTELGKLAIAMKLLLPAVIFIEAAHSAYFPLYIKMRDRSNGDLNSVLNLVKTYFRLIVLVLILVLFTAMLLMDILFDSRYHVDQPVFVFLIIGMFFNIIYRILASEIFYQKATKKIPILSLISGCVTLILSMILVPRIGLQGSALSMALGSVSVVIFTYLLFGKKIIIRFLLIDKIIILLAIFLFIFYLLKIL